MYGYYEMEKELVNSFPREVFSIGKSQEGRELLAVAIGEGGANALIFGAIHAREYITAKLVVMLAQNYNIRHKKEGTGIKILFVPMLNPDGVEFVVRGFPLSRRGELAALGNAKLWKANSRGVDLNVNFDAGWGKGQSNIFHPWQENYVGEYPFSESETRAIRDATYTYSIKQAISYHTKGEVIYQGFRYSDVIIDQTTWAQRFGNSLGYPVLNSENSYGGYKDWFLYKGLGNAVTIEVGSDSLTHPIGLAHLDRIWLQNKGVTDILNSK